MPVTFLSGHSDPARQRIQNVLKAAAILCVALNMRTLFPSVSTLLPEISAHFHLSASAAGYLTMLPVLCLGLFAPLAAWLARRIGADHGLCAAIGILTLALALRVWPNVGAMYLGTLLGGGAIAVANVLVPVLVKRDFSSRMGLMTGLYTTCICAGSAIAAAATVPLSKTLPGGWSSAIGAWAVPAALATALWCAWYRPAAAHSKPTQRPATARLPLWRQRLAWEITIFMGLQSSLAFSVMGWIAPILRQRGMSDVDAGLVVSLILLIQMGGSLTIPSVAIRCRNQQWLNVALIVSAIAGLAGLTQGPLGLAWFWTVPLGIAQGGMLGSALTLLVLRSPSAHVAASMSAMAQCLGYTLASMAPALIGVLLPAAGLLAVMGLFCIIGVGLLYSGWRSGRAVLLQGE